LHASPSTPRRSNRARRGLTLAAIAPSLLVASVAAAQSAAVWTEFQGGPARTGVSTDGPEPGLRQVWHTEVPPGGPDERFGLSAPIVSDDVAVAVGPEQVLGFDISSGTQVFEVDRDLGPSVPAAAATVGQRTVIVYTEGWGDGPPSADPAATEASPSASSSAGAGVDADEVDSHLAAFDLDTQQPSWAPIRLDGVSRTGVTVLDGTAIVGVNDGTITAVDLTDGSLTWERQLDARLVTPLAAADGLVLAGLQGGRDTQPEVVALDVTSGQERWRHEPTTASALVSAVSVADGRVLALFAAGLGETSVVALDAADGAEAWNVRVSAPFDVVAPPVVTADTVFVTDFNGHSLALETATGERRWDFAQNTPTLQTVPMLVGSHLLVPSLDGALGAIDIETGELVWRRADDGSPMRALAAAGEMLIAVRGGALSGVEALEHDPDAPLVRESSPTTLALGRMVGSMGLAAVGVLALVLLAGRVLSRRTGPALTDNDGSEAEDEPIRDPWEDEDPTQ